ncbi:hypothetical protein O9929_26375 [Vibrio lentus]|nr:hypothetical protein [Vibrio lentus]
MTAPLGSWLPSTWESLRYQVAKAITHNANSTVAIINERAVFLIQLTRHSACSDQLIYYPFTASCSP